MDYSKVTAAHAVEDYSKSVKLNIPVYMEKVQGVGKKPKITKKKIKFKPISDDDKSFFENVKDLQLSNYYEVKGVAEGYKEDMFIITTLNNDLNQIVILSNK